MYTSVSIRYSEEVHSGDSRAATGTCLVNKQWSSCAECESVRARYSTGVNSGDSRAAGGTCLVKLGRQVVSINRRDLWAWCSLQMQGANEIGQPQPS